MSYSFARNALVLGLLSAVGPFAIDMYLPALPAISSDLQVSVSATQMTLMSFFVAFGLSQIFYGPAADVLGRKVPLYFGLVVFIIGSIGCHYSADINELIACRAVQGLGGAAVMVIPRAIIRDLHTGVEATRLMSLVMLVFSISPCLAPLTGSFLTTYFSWRAVFLVLTGAAVLSLGLVAFALKETLAREDRVAGNFGTVISSYWYLLRNARFWGVTFVGGFGMSSFFVFLASSSFIYMDHFGLSGTQYSFAFAINALAFIGASQFSAALAQRFGVPSVISAAAAVFAAAATALFIVTLAGMDNLAVLISLLFVANAGLGLVIPASMVLALEDHGPIAGMASALGGTLQMVAGALTIAAASPFFNGTALPMVATIFLCALATLALARITLRPKQQPVTA